MGAMLHKLAVLLGCASICLSSVISDATNDQAGRRLTQVVRLDYDDQYHAHQHVHGAEVIAWLSDINNVLPEPALPQGRWPQNLVIGYAAGYTYELLKPLIIGFLMNVKEGALVLLTPSGRIPGLPPAFKSRVIVQKHELPEHIPEDSMPYAVCLRFYAARALLMQIQHTGKAFMCDSRDVFIQKDMFEAFDDEYLHFPRESGAYRLRGPFSQNSNWITQCYGQTALDALGGHYVLNSGTFLGPSQKLLGYIDLMLEEFKHRWHCMRTHGSDQAIHNVLVYTGKLIGSGLKFSIEDLETGRFAHVAWVHGGLLDFRAMSDDRAELYNRVGDAFVAIHLWSADSDVGKQVVLPFVKEFEPRLLNQGSAGSHASTSGAQAASTGAQAASSSGQAALTSSQDAAASTAGKRAASDGAAHGASLDWSEMGKQAAATGSVSQNPVGGIAESAGSGKADVVGSSSSRTRRRRYADSDNA